MQPDTPQRHDFDRPAQAAGDDPPATPTRIRIWHQDDAIVVVSKPSGMLVHKAANAPHDDVVLLQTLKAQIGMWLYPVQRLDRATSGVIAFGLSSLAAAGLQRSLQMPTCRKEYYALVRGAPPDRFASQRPLRDDKGTPQPAHTEFCVLRRWRGCALVRARIHTGRSNQIRRHLNHLAHHVLGDTTFGKGRLNRLYRRLFGLPRLFLHATRLCFEHPHTGSRLQLHDPLPHDLRAVLHRLDALSAAVPVAGPTALGDGSSDGPSDGQPGGSGLGAYQHESAVVAQRPLADERPHAGLDSIEQTDVGTAGHKALP